MQSHYDEYDYRFKIIIIGNENTGKTSLIKKLTTHTFDKSYTCTVGVDFALHMVHGNVHKSKLNIWDTAGQERFNGVIKLYYKRCHGVIMMFDLNVRSSFTKLEYWMNEIKKNINEKPFIVLIGNKNDLEINVTKEEIDHFCQKYNIEYHELSVKNISIDELEDFFKTFTINLKNYSTIYDNEVGTVSINESKKKTCCWS